MSIISTSKDKTIRPSVCPLDCGDTCSLSVTVEKDQIISVKGSNANPYTAGVICGKVAKYYPNFVHGNTRLKTPMKRVGKKGEAKFTPITWDEALDTIVERFTNIIDSHGAEAIVPFNYAGPHGLLASGSMDRRFFNKLGASQLNRGPLCAGIYGAAYNSLYGPVPGMRPEQAAQSKLLIVWGNNTSVSNLHFHRVIKTIKAQGGKVVVIDPKRTKIAQQADLHLQIMPGTDVVLALAIAAELQRNGGIDQDFVNAHVFGFDEYMEQARVYTPEHAAEVCRIDSASIRELAEMYKVLSPAAISMGVGPERNRNGGAGIRAALALPALAGKFGVPGGGIVGLSGNAFPKTPDKLQRPDLRAKETRVINILDIPSYILEMPKREAIKGLFIYNHNPLAVHPDQNKMRAALSEETLFTVGCDVELNDSMAYADILLPACTHFEHDDLFTAYGQQHLQRAEPVIRPVGESLPNTEIFRRLAHRFSFRDVAFTETDNQLMRDAIDFDDERLHGKALEDLSIHESLEMKLKGEDFVLFGNIFPKTPSGKVELVSEDLANKYNQSVPTYQPLLGDFPLRLVTPSSSKRTNSTFGGAPENSAMQLLEMHSTDALQRKLEHGQIVKVINEGGEVHLTLKITDDVRAGVVYCDKGAWLKTSPTGMTCNALVPSSRSDIADGACYNDTLVEVETITARL